MTTYTNERGEKLYWFSPYEPPRARRWDDLPVEFDRSWCSNPEVLALIDEKDLHLISPDSLFMRMDCPQILELFRDVRISHHDRWTLDQIWEIAEARGRFSEMVAFLRNTPKMPRAVHVHPVVGLQTGYGHSMCRVEGTGRAWSNSEGEWQTVRPD